MRIVEIAGIGPAPFAGMLLADLGAEVLRVDRPGAPAHPGDPRHDLLGRGKRSVVLDLKRPEAAEVVRHLAGRADALIEGFRPGVAERLGIGPDDCRQVNPALVYGRMTGWGQDGPLAPTAGHDITYLALSGVLHAIGPADGPPVPPVNLLGDYGGGGMLLAFGVMAAAWSARRTGVGQVVDASIVDGAALLSAQLHGFLREGMWADRRGANLLDGAAPNYGVYTTSDGHHLAVGPLEPKFWAEFSARVGVDGNPYDPADWPALRERIAERIATRTRAEWLDVFDGSDACVAPVLSLSEAAAGGHPHLAARGTFVESHGVTQPAPAPRFSATPAALTSPPPLPGEHTRQALADWGVAGVGGLLDAGVAIQA
ncbi:CaiB/BaiF CoA transferase family protein [Planosporangium mesophilum]|uniref:CoA transferase n=1 Tax=Planosporangium mesophilum TaxID=689768 RepID=A0A8J3T9X8_9ACTN|nr:CaiB/BaiF CoA-transferase family protein [Planosporangium mesophilum]NJC81002.1 CoA transferase [Planosporangium mesophilum]GII21356.1 CoA transferase [Planosporangium mesophilum]